MSNEYLHLSTLIEKIEDGYVWWEEMEKPDMYAVPPINITNGFVGYPSKHPKFKTIWSGWVCKSFDEFPTNIQVSKILDYEFIYDPKRFVNLQGSGWSVFRKNIRKWPKKNPDNRYELISNLTNNYYTDLAYLISMWINDHYKSKYGYEIYDYHSLLSFCFNAQHRKCLLLKNQIVGINIWDENYKFINYRFCIALPDQPFLDEYLRYLFYTDPEIVGKNKLVNDGGILDNPGLLRFKRKLHPVEINSIHSWNWKSLKD